LSFVLVFLAAQDRCAAPPLFSIWNPDVLHLQGMVEQDRPLGRCCIVPVKRKAMVDKRALEMGRFSRRL
jgi:hypothetical protein